MVERLARGWVFSNSIVLWQRVWEMEMVWHCFLPLRAKVFIWTIMVGRNSLRDDSQEKECCLWIVCSFAWCHVTRTQYTCFMTCLMSRSIRTFIPQDCFPKLESMLVTQRPFDSLPFLETWAYDNFGGCNMVLHLTHIQKCKAFQVTEGQFFCQFSMLEMWRLLSHDIYLYLSIYLDRQIDICFNQAP